MTRFSRHTKCGVMITSWHIKKTSKEQSTMKHLGLSMVFLFGVFFIFANESRAQWVQTNGPAGGIIQSLAVAPNASGSTDVFAGTPGGVFRSTNNGAEWSMPSPGLVDAYVYALAALPGQAGGRNLFAGTDRGVFLSMDDGVSWTSVDNGLTNFLVVALAPTPNGSGGTNLFAGTLGGGICLTTDKGSSWVPVNTGLNDMQIRALSASPDGAILVAAGDSGEVFVTRNNGANWTEVRKASFPCATGSCLATSRASNGALDLFVGIYSDGIYSSIDTGTTWAKIDGGIPGGSVVNTLVVSPDGTSLYAGLDGGPVYVSNDNGSTWTLAASGLTCTRVYALAPSPRPTGGYDLFVGTNTGVYVSGNDGATWSAANTGLAGTYVKALAGSSDGHLFAGTTYSSAFVSADNGSTWTSIKNGLDEPGLMPDVLSFVIVSDSSTGTKLFAGNNDGVHVSTDNGGSWTALNADMRWRTVYALTAAGTDLFAGTDYGIFHSTDFGVHWTQTSQGLTNLAITALLFSGTNLYAGTGGGIYVSSDKGASWSQAGGGMGSIIVNSFAAIQNGTGGTSILAGAAAGSQVYVSTDNGASWSHVDLGSSVVACNALVVYGKNIFAGTYGGGILLSTDGGASWAQVNTGLLFSNVKSLAVQGNNLFAGICFGGVWRRPLSDMIQITPVKPVLLSGYGTATIDGVLNADEWATAAKYDLSVNVPRGGTTPATLYVMNDNQNLYLALRFRRSTVDPGNSLTFEFDNNNDGMAASGDDIIGFDPPNSFVDGFRTNLPPCTSSDPAACGFNDADYGGTNDGSGAFKNDGTFSVYEMSHPLNSGDIGHDFALNPGDTVGFFLMLRMIGPGGVFPDDYADTFFPGWRSYGQIVTCKPSASQLIGSVSTQINNLMTAGALTKAQGQVLNLTVDQAVKSLNNGRNGIAIVELDAFIIEVQLYERLHLLTTTQGQSLITGTNSAINAIRHSGGNLAVSSSEEQGILSKAADVEEVIVPEFRLNQNNPNPFNPTTQIQFTVPSRGHATLCVFNTLGQKVANLFDGEADTGNIYEATFNAAMLPSGVYFARLDFGGKHLMRKMLLVK